MTINSNVYVGPYLLVSVKIIDTTADKCGDPARCPNAKTSFCPMCGLDLSTRFETESKLMHDIGDLANANGFLVADSVDGPIVEQVNPEVSRHVLLPNDTGFYTKHKRTLEVRCPYGSMLESWRGVDPRVEIADFEILYGTQMLALQRAGCINIVVDWGLVQWCR